MNSSYDINLFKATGNDSQQNFPLLPPNAKRKPDSPSYLPIFQATIGPMGKQEVQSLSINRTGQYLKKTKTSYKFKKMAKQPPPTSSSTDKVNIGLSLLNQEIGYFLAMMNNKIISDSALLLSLEKIAGYYHQSLQEMYLHNHLPEQQVRRILSSTYFNGEPNNTINSLKAPDSTLTIFLIVKFFQSLKIDQESLENDEFINCLVQCSFILYMIKVAGTYMPSSVAENLKIKLVKKYITTKISQLEDNQKFVLPGGWLNIPDQIEGHFMLYVLEKKDSSTFIKTRINTHSFLPPIEADKQYYSVEQETISSSDVDQFISDILELLFPKSLNEKLALYAPHKQLEILCATGKNYSDALPTPPKINQLPSQDESVNCCFMACFMLYQYLYIKTQQHISFPTQLENQAFHEGLTLRKQFQKFLLDNLKLNAKSQELKER
jgi:hypothetical protein